MGSYNSGTLQSDYMGVIQKMLKNYVSILQNLREGHTLLFVLHIFFVGGAVLTLLLVLLAGVLRLLGFS